MKQSFTFEVIDSNYEIFINIILGLVLLGLTDLYFEYVISGDYTPVFLTFLASAIIGMFYTIFFIRVIKQINNHLKTNEKP